MLKKLLATMTLMLFAVPAFASHCPKDVKAIDAALEKGTSLNAEQLAKVKKMRDEGEELHNTGKHKESVEVLHEAMDMMGMKHP